MDSNGNGGVSLAEFQDWMSYAFNQIDKNGNDVIDADEALVPKMRGITRTQQRANFAAQFRRQDKNKNGELSMSELTAPPQ
jgi:Ca2+-binding EF-hand superfamily protein